MDQLVNIEIFCKYQYMFGCRIPFSGISGTAFHFFKIKLQLIYAISRSSHQRCPMRKGVLRNFAKFTRKHLCQSLFLNKVAGLNPATLLKKKLWHRCLPVNFAKFLRKPFLQNTFGRLFLYLKLLRQGEWFVT